MPTLASREMNDHVPLNGSAVRQLDLRAALDAAVYDFLGPVCMGLGGLFAILAVCHVFVLPAGAALIMAALAAISAAALVGLGVALNRRSILTRLAHPIGAVIAGLCLLNSLVHLYLVFEPRQTTNLLMLIVGVGFLFLSTPWLGLVIAATWIGWGIVVWLSPPSPEWLHFCFALLLATILSAVIHTVRVRTVKRLETLRLQQQSQKTKLETSLASTEEALRLAETLNRVGRALTSTLDLTEVLERVLEHLSSIVPFDRGSVMMHSGDQMEIVAARGFPPNAQPLQIRVSLLGDDNDIYRHIYLTQQPLSIPDVAQRPDWQYVEGLPPARSWLGVPLIRADVVIGMLSLTRETLRRFGDDETTLAMAFAGQAALALENARLYDSILRDYAQLERLDRTKSDFINIASHELRTPLTTLLGYSQMLLDEPVVQANPYHTQLVSGLCSSTVRLREIVESMLDMAKVDSRTLRLHAKPLSVPALIQLVSSDVNRLLVERHHTLKLGDMSNLPQVEADLDTLHKVFYHLLVNAIKYTPDGGTITISGRAIASGQDGLAEGGIEIIVSDTGIGIDPRFHELIFAKFYQTGEVALHSTGKNKFKGGGPGLGLAIARGIVRAHGGKLWVESPGHDEKACPGSQFHVVLPLRQPLRNEISDSQSATPITDR